MSTSDSDSESRTVQRRLPLDAETLLKELTTLQHVGPHAPLRTVLVDIRACPIAAQRAVEWLGLDADLAIGRLKRAELIQLARSLHRFWRRATADATGAPVA